MERAALTAALHSTSLYFTLVLLLLRLRTVGKLCMGGSLSHFFRLRLHLHLHSLHTLLTSPYFFPSSFSPLLPSPSTALGRKWRGPRSRTLPYLTPYLLLTYVPTCCPSFWLLLAAAAAAAACWLCIACIACITHSLTHLPFIHPLTALP